MTMTMDGLDDYDDFAAWFFSSLLILDGVWWHFLGSGVFDFVWGWVGAFSFFLVRLSVTTSWITAVTQSS
jgi:hypothetical protein